MAKVARSLRYEACQLTAETGLFRDILYLSLEIISSTPNTVKGLPQLRIYQAILYIPSTAPGIRFRCEQ